jgi:O-antigen ligase
MTFLGRKPIFVLTAAVLFTTIFSFFNLNSQCILLLLACRLFIDGPKKTLTTAFSNKYFLVYFIYCLIGVIGLLYTHDLIAANKIVSKEATLTAIAFAICAGPFATPEEYKRLITVYNLLILLASFYCLIIAFRLYLAHGDASVFFYHPLTAPISQNAVFYSVFVLFGLQFLLSREGSPDLPFLPPAARKGLRLFMVLFFLLMILLLNSKLVLVIALLMLVTFLFRRSWRNRLAFVLCGLGVAALVIILAVTNNPVRQRFAKMTEGDEVAIPKELNYATNFNALQLRLLEWKFAGQILREHPHSWLFGVSPGDSQDLLDQKYVDNNMWIGDPRQGPNRHIRGFLGYNFHDQFIETMVRSGIIGLASLLAIFWMLWTIVWLKKTKEAFFTVVTITVFFLPQSPLTMQHGVFLFCFFPLLLLYSPKHPGTAQEIGEKGAR